MTIVDTRFLLATPVDYFIAGIADTLAKYYEMEAIVRTMAEEDKTALVRLRFSKCKTNQRTLDRRCHPSSH